MLVEMMNEDFRPKDEGDEGDVYDDSGPAEHVDDILEELGIHSPVPEGSEPPPPTEPLKPLRPARPVDPDEAAEALGLV